MNKVQLPRASSTSNFVPLALAALLFAAHARAFAGENLLRYEIVATHPHDTTAFTQGLALLDGEIVESRGRYGASAVTIGAITTGTARLRRDNSPEHFGEGLAVAGRTLLQLTWRSGLAFAYDAQLRLIATHRYDGEGWGLAFDGTHWLMSDGSSRIVRRRLDDFAPAGGFRVTDRGRPVRRLNELEFARGRLYANVWHSDRVAVIEPASGQVESWVDFSALRRGFPRPREWSAENVLNGIAFDPAKGHFYVTGKGWPVLYEVRLVDARPAEADPAGDARAP
jgi:glutaminyl-peptide cyclotransferase